MQSPWVIRQATIADADQLRRCMQLAYTPWQEKTGSRLPPMDLDYAEEIRAYPTWVATAGDTVVGGLTMTFADDHAAIANVAVHPDFQGRGLGKGLLQFAESQARDRHLAEIRLATHVMLEENVALYRHLGWSESKRDELRVYMYKYLDG